MQITKNPHTKEQNRADPCSCDCSFKAINGHILLTIRTKVRLDLHFVIRVLPCLYKKCF